MIGVECPGSETALGRKVTGGSLRYGSVSALVAMVLWNNFDVGKHNDGNFDANVSKGDFQAIRDQNVFGTTAEMAWAAQIMLGAGIWKAYQTQPTGFLHSVGSAIQNAYAECNWKCIAATGATAAISAALVAVACPVGTVATFGLGALFVCAGLGSLGLGATMSIFQATRASEPSGIEILCSMAVGAVYAPGMATSIVEQAAVTGSRSGTNRWLC